MNLETTADIDYFLETGLGILKIGVSPNGLKSIIFEECTPQRLRKDTSFRDTFMRWLHFFQDLTLEDQWTALSLQGTEFQKEVWHALLRIPMGNSVSYNTIAHRIGRPKANRAVGSAVGANPISILIPCHRVTPAQGGVGNYRWGSERKKNLLEVEKKPGMTMVQLFQKL